MSHGKILPNCVGRLDPVVDATKRGEANRAWSLLQDEYERRQGKTIQLQKELDREMEFLYEVGRIRDIAASMSTGGSGLLGVEWDQLRKECGWAGPTYANHVQATAEAYKSAALVYDAPEGLMETSPVVDDIEAAIVRDAVERTDREIVGDYLHPGRPSTKVHLAILGRDGSELWKVPMDNMKSAMEIGVRLSREGYNVCVENTMTDPIFYDPKPPHKRLWPPDDSSADYRIEST